jgi:uncharacterized RDD family membrane protein YckC
MRYWLSNNDGKTRGPYELEQIRSLVGAGSLSPMAQVCAEGSTEWMPVASILTAPPTAPVPGSAMLDGACGCCGMSPPKKPKKLYGHTVCKTCYYKFANRRQMAYIVDWICFVVASLLIGGGFGAVAGAVGTSDEAIELVGAVLGWALLPVFLLKDGIAGCSPGKALCGVRVIDSVTGTPIGPVQSLKRNLPIVIPIVPIIILIQMLKGPRLGDGWARTKVIWKRYESNPVFQPTGTP